MPGLRTPLLLLLLLLALLGAGCGRAPTGEPQSGTSASVPGGAREPSVVDLLETDPAIVLGEFRLARQLPAVVDGDTIRVEGLDESLRLVCIDTEEVFAPGREELRKLAERDWPAYLARMNADADPTRPPKYATPMGHASARFAADFFRGHETVRLEYDRPDKRRGYYNRHLVHVLVRKDSRWINYNVEAVRLGHSPYFVKYGESHRYHGAFLAAEAEARARGRGIWSEPPVLGRYPDYPARLAWWEDRNAALKRLERRRGEDPEIFVLGFERDFERMKTLEGRRVTVAGELTSSRPVERQSAAMGTIGILYLAHRIRNDFAIVGPLADVQAHPIRAHAGRILLATGEISLHRGSPQFLLETLTFESL